MIPTQFPQQNIVFGPPPDLDESQCGKIPAHIHEITSGQLDGSREIIVAWQPSYDDIDRIIKGHPVYVSFIGGVFPHRLSTSFEEARTQ